MAGIYGLSREAVRVKVKVSVVPWQSTQKTIVNHNFTGKTKWSSFLTVHAQYTQAPDTRHTHSRTHKVQTPITRSASVAAAAAATNSFQ